MFSEPDWDYQDDDHEDGQKEAKPQKMKNAVEGTPKEKQPTGSLLRQGIKFASPEEFCQFVDGDSRSKKKKNKKKKKRKSQGDEEEEGEGETAKKPKFDVEKLSGLLKGDKTESPAAGKYDYSDFQ